MGDSLDLLQQFRQRRKVEVTLEQCGHGAEMPVGVAQQRPGLLIHRVAVRIHAEVLGFDAAHGVERVVFEGINYLGREVATPADMNLRVNEFAREITVRPGSSPSTPTP